MDRDSIIRQGESAKALLESEEFRIAMQAVTLQAFRSFRDSKPEASAERENHYHLLRAVEQVSETLQAMVDNAKVEVFNATKEAKQQTMKDLDRPDSQQ